MTDTSNGAQVLIQSLVNLGVDVCFTNPGTSEMHFVAALDAVPQMRGILVLFEGVATGAADGYARATGKPACTLLHLGPGMANSIANMHNAKKARSPMVNVVGDHALYHRWLNAPLTSDLEALARPMSHWVDVARSPGDVGEVVRKAIAETYACGGQISTLVLPADVAWNPAAGAAEPQVFSNSTPPRSGNIDACCAALSKAKSPVLLLRDSGLSQPALQHAARIADATGARLMCDTFAPRLERGAGMVKVERVPYFAEQIVEHFAGTDLLILAGTTEPVAFFAYPDKPSRPLPEGCQILTLTTPGEDGVAAMQMLADACGVKDNAIGDGRRATREEFAAPTGELTLDAVGISLASLLPEGAMIADEAATSGLRVNLPLEHAAPHSHMSLTGGSIGQGVPLATGMAVGAPDSKIVCLQGDGGAMYTIQALWTQAREKLDVINIIFANRSYRILNVELSRVGAGAAGERALSMFDLTNPNLDFVKLAEGMGVPGHCPRSAEEFTQVLQECIDTPGPHLIEVLC